MRSYMLKDIPPQVLSLMHNSVYALPEALFPCFCHS
jgi:hypothetical protein